MITFKRNGSIMRGDVRVGMIEQTEAIREWKLTFTQASGFTLPAQYFATLGRAKEIARIYLSGAQS